MKPHNVNSVLLLGPAKAEKSSLLYQCAVHYAEQGAKVLYISSTVLNAFPPPIHGVLPPSTAALSNIRFLYLPNWQDLLQHLYSLHQHAQVPGVIMVEGLNHYCNLAEKSYEDKHEHKMHASLVCASLLDATSVCAKCAEKPSVLIASFSSDDVNVDPLIDIFFSNSVWLVDTICNESGVSLTNVVIFPEKSERTRIEFKLRNWDVTLVLYKILKLVGLENTSIDNVADRSLSPILGHSNVYKE